MFSPSCHGNLSRFPYAHSFVPIILVIMVAYTLLTVLFASFASSLGV